jgi:hypothetical protein
MINDNDTLVRLTCGQNADFAVEGTQEEAAIALKDHARRVHNIVLTDDQLASLVKGK